MNSFENIQKSWLSQPVSDMESMTQMQFVQNKWQNHQRKVLFTNLAISLGFLTALIIISWVYIAFRSQYGWPFDVSIVAINCLLILFLIVTWRGYGLKKENLEVSGTDFIKYQITRLEWQRKILNTYVWIYCVLLWLALSFYVVEVTKKGSVLFTLTALGVTTGYLLGMALWVRFRKNKRQLRHIDELINELKQLHDALN